MDSHCEMKTYEEHSIDVMDIAVFPATMMDIVLWHGDLGTVEDGWLWIFVSRSRYAKMEECTSFISFQMKTSFVLSFQCHSPLLSSSLKSPFHHSQLAGLK